MKLSKNFIIAWRQWNRMEAIDLDRRDLRTDPGFHQIISELGDLDTYVYSLVQSVISGTASDAVAVASQDITSLDRLAGELSLCEISDRGKDAVAEYISKTRAMLTEMISINH